MITKKNNTEIISLRKAGRILAQILREMKEYARPGMSTKDLDDLAYTRCIELKAEPVLLGYHPSFADMPYPATTCISVNDVVQHGIPSEKEILYEGDVVDIDMSLGYEGMIVDAGFTFIVGDTESTQDEKLIAVTKEALKRGIAAAKPGNRIGDISHAIQTCVESEGYSVVKSLAGHGVGYAVHEPPLIPNHGKPGKGAKIEVGHVYAIEPIVNVGGAEVIYDDSDGYSVYTKDGKNSAHFEHTVVITPRGAEILTKE